MGCCHGCTGGILGWVWGELEDWKESSVGTAPTSSRRLFHSGIVQGGGGGCCRHCVSTSCERADHRVGVGLMATFSPSSVYSWQAGLLKIDVHPAIVKLFKVVSLATLLSSVS